MDDIINTLQYLEVTGEVNQVDSTSHLDVSVVKELYDAGLIEAIDVSSLDGPAFIKVRINLRGREWLKNENASGSDGPAQANEDIVDVKPNFMGIGLNLNAAWRKWRGGKT